MCVFSAFEHSDKQEILELRLQLLRNGYEPLPASGKKPMLAEWTTGDTTEERIRIEADKTPLSTGTGLRTGPLVGVDIDIVPDAEVEQIAAVVEAELGRSPLVRFGAKGATICYRNQTPIAKINIKEPRQPGQKHERGVEIHGLGQQFIGYGIHPETNMPYGWGDDDPTTIPLADLPEVTPEQLRNLAAKLHAEMVSMGYQMKPCGERTECDHSATARSGGLDDDVEDIEAKVIEAMKVIRNDLDRDEWIRIGEALANGTNKSGLGFELWTEFCRRWTAGTNTEAQIKTAWSSFQPRSVSAATLFWYADRHDPSWRARVPGSRAAEDAVELRLINEHSGTFDRLGIAGLGRITLDREWWHRMGFSDEERDPTNATGASAESITSANAVADEPLDIFGSLTPEPILDADMLPETIMNVAFDVAERMGISPTAVAVPMLGVCSAAINDRILIQPKQHDTGWTESSRLWLCGIGDPGTLKTPAQNAAADPLAEIELTWRQEDAVKLRDYERAYERYKHQIGAYNRRVGSSSEDLGPEPQEPEKPPQRRLIATDYTMEGLSEILADNPRGILLKLDELTGFLGSFDAYRNGKTGKDRAAALELWNGGRRAIDRIRGSTLVPNWSASIVSNIQDEKLATLARTLTDDGLLQRFFLYRVEQRGIGVDRAPNEAAVSKYTYLMNFLVNLEPTGHPVRLSGGAQEFRREVERIAYALSDLSICPPSLRAHASKLNGLFARLLLTMHVIDHHTQHGWMLRDDDFHKVSPATAKRARDLMVKFLIPHAVRVYSDYFGGWDENGADARWIAGHILAHRLDAVNQRDLYRNNRVFEKDRNRLNRAIDALVRTGWLEPAAPAWKVNPVAHTRFAERAEQERQRREGAKANIAKHAQTMRNAYNG